MPEAIQKDTLEALQSLPSTSLRRQFVLGWSRLRQNPPHIAGNQGLAVILERVISAQLGIDHEGPTTFAQLYEATGIELYIVAVDAVSQREFVFHHAMTPEESVAAAAIASAAILLYFPAGTTRSAAPGEESSVILFDGGIWSNFPSWIYRDPSFTHFHFGKSRYIQQDGSHSNPFVVGFLLDENRSSDGSTVVAYYEPQGNKFDEPGVTRVLFWLLFMLTSPILVVSYAVFGFATAVVLTRVMFPGHTGSYLARAWDSHALSVGVCLGGLWLTALIFQMVRVSRRWKAKSREYFIPPTYPALELLGSFMAVSPLLAASALINASHDISGKSLFLPGTESGVILAPALLGLLALGVLTAAFASLVYLGPAAIGLAPWIVPTMLTAGSARYWVGSATDDWIIRLGVNGIGTLDFKGAQAFLNDNKDNLYRDTIAQWPRFPASPRAT